MEKIIKKLEEHLSEFYDILVQKGKEKDYILSYVHPIKQFIKFAKQKLVFYPHQVTNEIVGEYQLALYKERSATLWTVSTYVYRLRKFFKILAGKGIDVQKNFDILPKPKPKEGRLKRYYTFDDLLKRYLAIQRKWI